MPARERITSTANPAIKAIRALRDRRERERTGLALVEGIRLVGEAIQTGASIHQLVWCPERITSDFAREQVSGAERSGVPILEVSPAAFESLSGKDHPQGLAAVVRQRWHTLDEVVPGDELCWIALSGVQDPGNLGTILRTAGATGAAGVILLGSGADPYDPTALRASMGAVFSQRLVRATLADLARWKTPHSVAIIGASGEAAAEYRSMTYPRPLVLLMGSERQGLTPEEQAICDLMVKIPMVGRSDSLNLAVATAVLLYEVFEQRRASTRGGRERKTNAEPAAPSKCEYKTFSGSDARTGHEDV